jgi:hypothetical protein
MIDDKTLKTVLEEMDRLHKRIEALLEAPVELRQRTGEGRERICTGTVERLLRDGVIKGSLSEYAPHGTAAVRRASLDLSQALLELRRH